MTTILLVLVATTLVLSQTKPVLATLNATTRINMFTATESGGLVTITGVLQYVDSSGNYQPLINSKITFYWWNTATGNVESNYVGEVYSNDKSASQPGGFAYNWQDGLEPGNYYLKGVYTANGASWSGYTFQDCMDDTPFSVSLILQVSLNNPTISLTQGGSVSLTVSVGTLNSKNPHPVTLSTTSSSQLFASLGFTPTLGNAPFTSTLSLNVLNVTQPGTYSMIITATSNEDSSVAANTPLIINVQQDTHLITINVEGLNSDAVTPLYVDSTFIENISTGSVTLTISNQAKQV
ncbi:MAG TPA: hypothetical protein VK503_00810, partial [Candidatus Bathyarchaeia archaeon]|nr:hypothetical protein [Candidatus Bathyarchaeia archaeon]